MHDTKRKKTGTLLVMFGVVGSSLAQQGISTAGGDHQSSSGTVAYTVGQTSFKSISSVDGTIQEGVQQPFIQLTPEAPKDVVVSNYVSPNNDGENDTWKVVPLEKLAAYEVMITDQWGTVVFRKEGNYNNEWDATNGGQKVLDGVYYFSFLDNGKVVINGSITVLGK